MTVLTCAEPTDGVRAMAVAKATIIAWVNVAKVLTVLALLGSVLVVGTAGAGECRPGAFSFVSTAGKAFKVQAYGFGGMRPGYGAAARTVFRGTVKGKPYIIDIQGVQGSSTTFTSYAGTKLGKGIAPKWGKLFRPYRHGDEMPVGDGPLEGEWRAVCQP